MAFSSKFILKTVEKGLWIARCSPDTLMLHQRNLRCLPFAFSYMDGIQIAENPSAKHTIKLHDGLDVSSTLASNQILINMLLNCLLLTFGWWIWHCTAPGENSLRHFVLLRPQAVTLLLFFLIIIDFCHRLILHCAPLISSQVDRFKSTPETTRLPSNFKAVLTNVRETASLMPLLHDLRSDPSAKLILTANASSRVVGAFF